MMDGARRPSRMLTVLPVFSALDRYIVFGPHGREAVVPSDRPQAGQKILWEAQERCGRVIALLGGAGSPSGLLMYKSPSGESPVTKPGDPHSVPCVARSRLFPPSHPD